MKNNTALFRQDGLRRCIGLFAQWARLICLGALCIVGVVVRADDFDDFIVNKMAERHIPGLSLAIVGNGQIIRAQGYGFADKGEKKPVTPATLFQAGSISKSVAAFGALHLVEKGELDLDADVNAKLRSWKVPENEFTREKRVTLRGILSHSAGITVHGFPGYAVNASQPTLVQILDGIKPANTPAIRVDIVPGSKWRYSGGGYTVMQQLILDVTGQPFPAFMRDTVLAPLRMTNSTYEQPLPKDLAGSTATGYYADGKAVKGRWHVYPEMAAAGLWTTASDLARFVIAVQQSYAGDSNPVLSKSMTHQMLTAQKDEDGLGVFLKGSGERLTFMHNGRDEGFDAFMMGHGTRGKGLVVLINANDDSGGMKDIVEYVEKKYELAR